MTAEGDCQRELQKKMARADPKQRKHNMICRFRGQGVSEGRAFQRAGLVRGHL